MNVPRCREILLLADGKLSVHDLTTPAARKDGPGDSIHSNSLKRESPTSSAGREGRGRRSGVRSAASPRKQRGKVIEKGLNKY